MITEYFEQRYEMALKMLTKELFSSREVMNLMCTKKFQPDLGTVSRKMTTDKRLEFVHKSINYKMDGYHQYKTKYFMFKESELSGKRGSKSGESN